MRFGRLLLVVFGVSACGTHQLTEESRTKTESDAATARVEAMRTRFGRTSIGEGEVLRFEKLANGRMHAIVDAPTGLTRPVRVELPASAGGEVSLEDVRSNVAIRFAQQSTHEEEVELAHGGLAVYGNVVHRVQPGGTEDFVHFEAKPAREELTYRVDVRRVPGLRFVSNTLEFLDDSGSPRLRVAPPYVIDAHGDRHDALLSIEGCAYDTNSDAPWGKPIVAPAAPVCVVRVSWSGIEYPALVDPQWNYAGTMSTARRSHTATLLPSGAVLIAGGNMGGGGTIYLSSAELYSAGTFAATGKLPNAASAHTATLLPSGAVLVTGGISGNTSSPVTNSTAFLYGAGKFTATGNLKVARHSHAATLLPSGKVLIAGGSAYTTSGTIKALSSAELFDGVSSFAATGSLTTSYARPAAALHGSGKVLIVGDSTTANVFDGVSTFTKLSGVSCARRLPGVVTLSSGDVLVAGGDCGGTATPPEGSTQIFNGTGWTSGPSMKGRAAFGIARLASGRILVAGGRDGSLSTIGLSQSEYFDGKTFSVQDNLNAARVAPTLTVLPSGAVLAAGGGPNDSSVYSSAELLTRQGMPGDACAVNADCSTNVCDANGICCAATTACTGNCMACTAGTGTCSAVKGTSDSNSCSGTQTCDSTGACKLANGQPTAAATNCASGLLADGVCCDTACGAACDACNNPGNMGTCSVAVGYAGSPACAPFLCQTATSCPTSCTTDSQCVSTAFCDAGVCKPKKSSGGTCSTGARECANGLCVDGFCCNTSCTSNCYACAASLSGVAGSDGACTLVANGGRGRGECGPASCSSGTTVSANVCNGSGSCTTKSTSCGAFACVGGACATACSKDADCGAGSYCNGTSCAAQKAAGAACSSASMCASGNCVDGVCCSTACGGACEACNEAGAAGTCVAVSGAPRGTHPACNGVGTPCAGTCDGVNRAVCSYPSAGAVCGSGCTGSSLSVCSGSGACLAPIACPGSFACASATACKSVCSLDGDCASNAYCKGSVCAPKLADGNACVDDGQCTKGHCVSGTCCASACTDYACAADGSACKTSCATDVDCTAADYCAGSACVSRKVNGTACTVGTECSSGNCADSVCCDRNCTGTCEACVSSKTGVAGSTGTCNFIVDGKDPDAECGTPTCTGSVLNANVCNGSGVCRASVTDCGSAKCVVSGTSGVCENTCTMDADCGGSGWCNSGLCAPKVDRANACGSSVECKSGFCVDGVCCNEACSGQCQACGEPGSVGTCIAVKGKPRAPRTDCNGSGGSCYGQCDGINLAACGYPSAGQSCGKGCTDGRLSVCDATGICLEPAACAGNFACDGTSKCKTTCAIDDDCASGFACASGKCTPKAAATCSADGTQSIPSADAGAPQTCAPYRCLSSGECGEKCTTTDDCADGSTCDTATQQCAPAAPSNADSGGCAVASSGRSANTAFALFSVLALALAARRRRGALSVRGGTRGSPRSASRVPLRRAARGSTVRPWRGCRPSASSSRSRRTRRSDRRRARWDRSRW